MPLEAQLTSSEKITDINLLFDENLGNRLSWGVGIILFEMLL